MKTRQRAFFARAELLAALDSRARALSAKEIAHIIGKHITTVHSMLVALSADGVVLCEPVDFGKTRLWKRTGKDLPQAITSTGKAQEAISYVPPRYDHRALWVVFHNRLAPPPVVNARIAVLEGRRL